MRVRRWLQRVIVLCAAVFICALGTVTADASANNIGEPNNLVPMAQSQGSGTDNISLPNTPGVAQAAIQRAAEAQLSNVPTRRIEGFWGQLQQSYGGYLPDVTGSGLIQDILGNGFHFKDMASGLVRYFFAELIDNAQLLGGILILSVLAAILESIQGAFERQAVSEIAYAVIFLVLLALAISSFTEAIGYAKHAISSMNEFMLATVPIVIALLAASGALASAAFYSPVLLFAIHFISNLVFLFVFPLIFFSAILDITSALSPRYKLTRLAGLMRTVGVAVLGIAMSAFLGVTAVQGAGKGIADGVALRTIKFSVSTFVPVIGKAVSDAAETVASASLLVKNAVGIAGLVIVASIAVFPALKILALSFIYNGSAAIMQPLGDNPIISCLGTLSKSLIYVFACVAAVALMFFVSICILLASANLAVMMG